MSFFFDIIIHHTHATDTPEKQLHAENKISVVLGPYRIEIIK